MFRFILLPLILRPLDPSKCWYGSSIVILRPSLPGDFRSSSVGLSTGKKLLSWIDLFRCCAGESYGLRASRPSTRRFSLPRSCLLLLLGVLAPSPRPPTSVEMAAEPIRWMLLVKLPRRIIFISSPRLEPSQSLLFYGKTRKLSVFARDRPLLDMLEPM